MKQLSIFSLIIFVAACAPSTQITGSWKNPGSEASAENISTILVTAMIDRTHARQNVENDLASALQEKGYKAIKSIDIIPPTFTNGQTPKKEDLLARIGETSADAILTVAVIDEKTETRYVPGEYGYAPMPRFGYYGTFWGYYTNWSPTLYAPGYYAEDKVYFIETNLYDAESEELLWSAQSETYNPKGVPDFASDFAEVVVTRLEREEILDHQGTGELATERRADEN